MYRRACCQLDVNLNLVKQVDFAQFTETIRPVTVVRALINEPPAA